MIDIHSHVIPFLDEGSSDYEISLKILKEIESQGVTTLFCTPHTRNGFYAFSPEVTKEAFEIFKERALKEGIKLNLLLGQEVHYSKDIVSWLKEGKVLSLNDTPYVLVEYSFRNQIDIAESVYGLVRAGYKPIVAHYERYHYATLDEAYEIVALGGEIQVNANTILGEEGKDFKKMALMLLKNDLVSFVAGDMHSHRQYLMEKAFNYVAKKFGEERANSLFKQNAKKLLK